LFSINASGWQWTGDDIDSKKQNEQKVMITAMLWQQWATAHNNVGNNSNCRGTVSVTPATSDSDGGGNS
jgi:hypothetical protein